VGDEEGGTMTKRPGTLFAAVFASLTMPVLLAATTGAGSPRAARQTQPNGSGHTFLTPPTPAEAGCSSDTALCLSDGRFQVEATWKTFDGTLGSGHPIALTSDSGYFWFFDPDNVELAVKTLNGCGINGHFWFFSGGLTNIEVAITITDTVTNEVKTYSNPAGTAFQPILDTKAFEGCSEGPAALSARNPEEPLEEVAMATPVRAPAAERPLDTGCVGSDTVLCVNGRFQVEASWQIASGATGPAYAVPLTSESGYFWFFEPSNVELIVKELDACSIGWGQWFFAAGMTNVGVQINVTDTLTGELKTYANLLGTSFLPIQDTAAFAFCPTPGSQVYTVKVVNRSGNLNFAFSPDTIHIHVGDAIHWVFDNFHRHSATSGSKGVPDGNWDSGVGPSSFTHIFTQAGSFPYFCRGGVNFKHRSHSPGVVIVDP
jgi:plastocyanin